MSKEYRGYRESKEYRDYRESKEYRGYRDRVRNIEAIEII